MSGRLTILPKKSYCPWNQENVERVLRDERLERERLEKQDKDTRRSRQQQREGDQPTTTTDGHINLFPEAKEAELKLARGQGSKSEGNNTNNAGVQPIPLGGDEANKRKMGALPFYMQSKTPTGEEGKYDKNSGLSGLGNRNRGGGGGAACAADEITSKIMRAQYASREDNRKDKMDPMSRFFASSSKPITSSSHMDANISKKEKQHISQSERKDRKKQQKKHSRRSRDGSSMDSDDSSSSSAKHKRRRKSEGKHHHKKSRRKDRRREKRRRRKSPSSDGSSISNKESKKRAKDELDELRKRRRAREAREIERERQVLVPSVASAFPERRHYSDQFNPA